jgi:hypothetical protein
MFCAADEAGKKHAKGTPMAGRENSLIATEGKNIRFLA